MSSDRSAADHTLVERIRQGDASAFETLILEHYRSLLRYVTARVGSNDDAEDILQEVFVRLWRRREEIYLTSEFKAYLFSAVRNQLLNHYRHERRKQHAQHALSQTIRFDIPMDVVSSELDERALADALRIAVEKLPARAREVWELHRDHNLSYPEIAEILGLSVNTVKSHMARAMVGIRSALGPFLACMVAVFH